MKLSAWLLGPMATAVHPERTSREGHLYSSWHMDPRPGHRTRIHDGVRSRPWGKRRSGRLGSTLMSEHPMTGYDSARRAIPPLVHRAEPSRGRRRAPRGRRGIRKAGRRILVGHPPRGARFFFKQKTAYEI